MLLVVVIVLVDVVVDVVGGDDVVVGNVEAVVKLVVAVESKWRA